MRNISAWMFWISGNPKSANTSIVHFPSHSVSHTVNCQLSNAHLRCRLSPRLAVHKRYKWSYDRVVKNNLKKVKTFYCTFENLGRLVQLRKAISCKKIHLYDENIIRNKIKKQEYHHQGNTIYMDIYYIKWEIGMVV